MNIKFLINMNESYIYVFILPMLICLSVTVHCAETDKCYLDSKTKTNGEEKLLNRISPLFGQIFTTQKNGYNYVVAICSDTSKLHANVSVTKGKIKEDALVLGRRNLTHLLGGDTWVMLRYECGDKRPNSSDSNNSGNQCLGHHSASIYIVCDSVKHDDSLINIRLTEEDGCNHKFVLSTTTICEHEEEVSGGTVFFIVFSVAFFMYFIVGIIYRRLVHNAQGCQQLPHFSFWQKIGALLSDGCSYVCRCDSEPEDSWNNIASNFDSGDRDDALLRP